MGLLGPHLGTSALEADKDKTQRPRAGPMGHGHGNLCSRSSSSMGPYMTKPKQAMGLLVYRNTHYTLDDWNLERLLQSESQSLIAICLSVMLSHVETNPQ